MNRAPVSALVVFALVAGIFLLASVPFTSYSLRSQAASLAAGGNFCVQVAGEDGYVPARGWRDTLGLLMRGHGGLHHAVLVVGDERRPATWHWSYLRNRFVPGTYGPHPVVCRPARDYFVNPARRDDDGALRFALDGRVLSIPRAYHPEPKWPGGMVGYMILATAPSFTPADTMCDRRWCNLVFVAFRGGGSPAGSAALLPRDDLAGRHESVHGLAHVGDSGHYLEIADDGEVITHVTCMKGGTGCSHMFKSGACVFSFHHAAADLARWRGMQRRLVALHERFEVTPPAPHANRHTAYSPPSSGCSPARHRSTTPVPVPPGRA